MNEKKAGNQCGYCHAAPARLQRSKHPQVKSCAPCFTRNFELEVLDTMVSEKLFEKGEKIALAVSGGKDSTVLLHVIHNLNVEHQLGIELEMLAIDEGIAGYRDHSLTAVKKNSEIYGLPLKILSYSDLFGLNMDQVVEKRGVKCSCTYCGVFRRRAMDLGTAQLTATKLYTGHNADDIAETVLLNALKGDAHKLVSCSETISGKKSESKDMMGFRKCKPLKYCFEKEIVLYAHYKKLVYFSNECTYAKEAFRGPLKELMKKMNDARPGVIEDMIRETQFLTLKKELKKKVKIKCKICGEVSSNETCKVCLFKEELTTEKEPPKKKIEVAIED